MVDRAVAGQRMTGSERTSRTELGTIGSIRCGIARTSTPWVLPFDTIVASVGTGLGGLASAIRRQFPDAAWFSIDFGAITPERPGLLKISVADSGTSALRRLILATPHDVNSGYSVSTAAIESATDSAIRLAVRNGARRLAIPLLATGNLGTPMAPISAIVVPVVLEALNSPANDALISVDFLCQEADVAARIADDFRSTARSRSFAWNPAPTVNDTGPVEPGPTPVDLAGGVSRDYVDPTIGIALHEDRLGMSPYAAMLATVIAEQQTPLPLSVGIFGEWGSGKSYFMGLLRGQIEALSGSDTDRYCERIVQIGFNAWHYSDSNLWASLGDEIFRQLAESPSAPGEAERLRVEFARKTDQRAQLEFATAQARVAAAELEAEVDAAMAHRQVAGRNVVTALLASPTFGRRMDGVWRGLGVADRVEQAKLFTAELRGTLGEADALRRTGADRVGRIALSVAAIAMIATAAALLIPQVREWVVALFGVVTLVTGGAGYSRLTRAHSSLRELRAMTEEVRAGAAAATGDDPEVAAKLAELRKAEADHRVAQAQLEEVIAQVGELGGQLAQLTPGRRLYTFLAERARSDSYTRNLGLASTIRKDLQQLVELMQEWRTNPGDSGAPWQPADRIVLYIDDLDRCRPDQVVDVLQAVHLLLAFELFVVVVGVDPRWLMHSLRSEYANLLHESVTEDAGSDRHTPEDYLEKILNIPLILPGMPSGSVERLLRSFGADGGRAVSVADPAPELPDAVSEVPEGVVDAERITIEAGADLDPARTASVPPEPLTEPEIALLAAMESLIGTPREAKRLVNLYRMIRSTRDLSPASRFLGLDGDPGEYQAVILLLALLTAHARLLGAVLDTRPDVGGEIRGGLAHRGADTVWTDFVADLEPRRTETGWATRVAGDCSAGQVPHWIHLHRGMLRLSALVALADLSTLHLWLPRVRCFSYVLVAAESKGRADDHR
ncbi:P-loop NTPase fold protein [Nocardia jiangsuensis]|uniref:P-loop NTPase fold protein n=1 Tax=Nocardia jiangsuensis TaxID=1691563 RepID=A0ABV8E0Z0_9NOCA